MSTDTRIQAKSGINGRYKTHKHLYRWSLKSVCYVSHLEQQPRRHQKTGDFRLLLPAPYFRN